MSNFQVSSFSSYAVLWMAERLVQRAVSLQGNPAPEKQGGYLTLINDSVSEIITLQALVGTIVPEERELYRAFSEEKPRRLLQNPGHWSSFQTRDPDNGKWGGAIRAGQWLIGFSGLPELMDEAVVTAMAYWLGCINYEHVVIVADISRNPHIEPLITHLANWPSLFDVEEAPVA